LLHKLTVEGLRQEGMCGIHRPHLCLNHQASCNLHTGVQTKSHDFVPFSCHIQLQPFQAADTDPDAHDGSGYGGNSQVAGSCLPLTFRAHARMRELVSPFLAIMVEAVSAATAVSHLTSTSLVELLGLKALVGETAYCQAPKLCAPGGHRSVCWRCCACC
jgi:hypothetical protein